MFMDWFFCCGIVYLITTTKSMFYDCEIWLQWVVKSKNMTYVGITIDESEHD